MSHQTIIVLDFGGQYNQLIARRVRECGVYCEVKPYTTPLAELKKMNPIGFIFTGGPNSVYLETSPRVDAGIFEMGLPVLGICYGCQLMAHTLGGKVTAAQDDSAREYGKTETFYDTTCPLFKGLPETGISWMSHGDYMEKVPDGFALAAHSKACPNVAIADVKRGFYGVQYHPEVNHTENGVKMIRNFLYEVCGAKGDWTMEDYKRTAIAAIREKVSSKTRMNSSPMIFRFRSGSVTPASFPRNLASASTRTKFIAQGWKAASTSSPSFFRMSPWSTNTHVSCSPTASASRAAHTELSTPPDSASSTRPPPTFSRMAAIAVRL